MENVPWIWKWWNLLPFGNPAEPHPIPAVFLGNQLVFGKNLGSFFADALLTRLTGGVRCWIDDVQCDN